MYVQYESSECAVARLPETANLLVELRFKAFTTTFI